MERAEKVQMVEDLGQIFSEAGAVVVTHYKGLTVAEMSDLRKKMRDAGAQFKVTKNRLAKIALDNTNRGAAKDLFSGPTGIAYSQDPVASAKVVTAYAKENEKLVVLGGILGEQAVDAKGVEALSKMPAIEELRAKLVGTLKAPQSKLVQVLPQPATKLVGQLGAPGQNLLGVLNAQKAKLEAA